jgi:hypothetical protein
VAIVDITDDRIRELIGMPKTITNPGARWRQVARAKLRDLTVVSQDGSEKFSLFVRQSTRLESSFSAGLIWHSGDGTLVLMRCNGASHVHGNRLEKQEIRMLPHIHTATARYISIGKKDEGYAEATDAYSNIDGAFATLIQRCNIAPNQEPDSGQVELFNA